MQAEKWTKRILISASLCGSRLRREHGDDPAGLGGHVEDDLAPEVDAEAPPEAHREAGEQEVVLQLALRPDNKKEKSSWEKEVS